MKGDARGFTLIEVLLAIMIGALLLTTIYGVFSSVSGACNRLEAEGEAYHQVRIFFDRIGGELRSLRLLPVGSKVVLSGGTSLDGDLFLEFNTELVSPLLQQRGGVSRVRYELRHEDETATIYRSEQVLLADLAASEPLPFIVGVKDFQIRYFQRGSWEEQWSKAATPQMIEIVLKLEAKGQVIPFRSSFVLPEIGR